MTDYGRFKIHPVADMFPLIEAEAFAALVDDIRQTGLGHPIVLSHDGDTIIDGRNRYRACEAALVDPHFTTLGGHYTEEMITEYIISENINRRHLSAAERAFIARDIFKYEQEAAELRMTSGLPRSGNPEVKLPQGLRAPQPRDITGLRMGVSGSYVDMAAKLEGHDDLEAEVRAGRLALAEANKQRVERDKQARKILDSPAPPKAAPVMLTLRTHTGHAVEYPQPQSLPTFNESTTEGISWAAWSWNPVTGCLHGCDYCYARDIATNPRYASAYPVGFAPLFHHERLDAPLHTRIPAAHQDDPAYRRVFVCSMADLYGRWVPDEWIDAVHRSMLAAPQWQYITLTKFPDRYVGLEMPQGAWVGTSVDEQNRVRIAEKAMRQLPDHVVKWLSLEPLKADLEFEDLSVFDWVVIGAQTATNQPTGHVPALAPDFEWVAKLTLQAKASGCQVHHKPNLINQNPGMKMLNEYPE